MKLKQSLLVAAFAFAGVATQAQTFSLSGEFRPRSEWFGNGQSSTAALGSEGYLSTSVRAALKAQYTTESYTVFTSFQEVFKFGDRTQISQLASTSNEAGGTGNNGSTFRVQEAWADIKLGEYSSLKVGRQPLSYDDQRILGGLGWAQQARTHDAAIFKYSNDGYSLDLGAALNTYAGTTYGAVNLFSYRDMGFLRINKKYGDLNLSLLGLVNTYQNGTIISAAGNDKATLITTGLHADYKSGILNLSANAFLQDGNRMVGSYQDVDGAYLASLDATIKAADKLTVLAGGEIISGKTDTSSGFFPLFGTNHKFNGLIDRFYVGNHANANGLVDLNLGLKTKVAGAAVTVKGHYFKEESLTKEDLGTELDLVVAKGFKGYKVVGGYSQFFEPDTTTSAQGAQNWAWLMLIISPKFL